MRKLTLALVFAFLLLAQLASAQQVDVFVGGGTLESASANSNFPSMGGGTYLNIGGDVVPIKHFGVNVETAWLATQGAYGGAQSGLNYRPILTDFNFLYQPHLGKRLGLDLMAGIGAGDTRLYESGALNSGPGNYASTDHFMEHFGAGLRIYVAHHIFVRPEVHYYYIQDNNSTTDNGVFSSNSAVRVGASVGYTFGGGSD